MKKKGDFNINELLSIIVAVLGLLLLIYGGYRLYQISSSNELESAQNILDRITEKIDSLEEGESSALLIQGFDEGDKWYLVGWGKSEEGRPDKCFFDTCICMCKEGINGEDCQKSGVCNKVNYDDVGVYRVLNAPGSPNEPYIIIPENFVEIGVYKRPENKILVVDSPFEEPMIIP